MQVACTPKHSTLGEQCTSNKQLFEPNQSLAYRLVLFGLFLKCLKVKWDDGWYFQNKHKFGCASGSLLNK